jgi:hypothetical protein
MASNDTTTPAAGTSIQMTGESLANAIITATEQINGTRRQVPFGRHRVRTAFNKDGKRREMHKVFYQNGFRAFENTLTDEEIDLIHTVKSGKFIDGLITIIEVQDDDENQPAVHMKYNCRTADQRMAGWRASGDARARMIPPFAPSSSSVWTNITSRKPIARPRARLKSKTPSTRKFAARRKSSFVPR